MSETKLSIKNQLYLGTVPWLFVFLIKVLQDSNFFSRETSSFLGLVSWIIIIITLGYETKEKEKNDEYANKIFGKVDGICIKALLWIVVAIIVFIDFPTNISSEFILKLFKNILCLIVIGIMFLRAILFSYYERKGI
ncbi:hypothetical protein [Clostridium sp. LIBA-8841]|uniref:hypothetical protein n=1 Tax=Clostridium sp. LIBA-8841 TaxID=2987530 RepID=UPI002AC63D0D|nr:hypothetical protein [Clostridium sp. LIBA-8841]MDZ5253644.1 hypothetical protein [Clostridium sp. LIBA-8841]